MWVLIPVCSSKPQPGWADEHHWGLAPPMPACPDQD